MKRLILLLIRMRLGLQKFEVFKFTNQKSSGVYYFDESNLIKLDNGTISLSEVSLNWLLNDQCKVHVLGDGELWD